MPSPVNAIFVVGFVESLLVMEIPPEPVPDALGEKVTDATTDWPALIVRGGGNPANSEFRAA